jgi:hypothetical protein
MMASRTVALLAGAMVPAAAASQGAGPQPGGPPTIECSQGFDALHAAALALPGAHTGEAGGFETVTQTLPEAWRVEILFTTRWHPAYPAVALRTLRKQPTGVWTADSKACGYGDQAAFAALVEDMRTRDKELTEASRAEAARKKAERSPLAPPH